MTTWPGARKGALHLYGHTHGELAGTRTCLDVGVDAHGFAPVTLDEAMKAMRRLPDWQAQPARWRG